MPIPLLIAIVVVALLAVALAAVLVLGRDPDSRLHPLRASATEAGERTSDLAAEFFDWLRIGR
ncbi:MAG: hypothetical protein QOH76_2725 [Thermoleophilaceae bacterium]|jgi:hypothetical protein|nr:hypothetical protein [Thermoleophilaceae bacterium]